MSQIKNLESASIPGFPRASTSLQNEAEDELLMQRLEIDALRQQLLGLPIERMIEGFVPNDCLEIHMARYRFAAELLSGRLLDMACGPGHGSISLAKNEKSDMVLGVDIDPDTVRYAALRYKNECLSFDCQDACVPWTSQKFDGITSFETIEHVWEPDKMLQNIVSMLEPDGCLVISTPVRRSGRLTDTPPWPYHRREWMADEFQELLSAYFDQVTVYGQQWSVRQDYGFIHLGKRLSRQLARLSGIDDAAQQRLRFEVIDGDSLNKRCVLPTPVYTVCVCRGPHMPADFGRAHQLAYGE